MFLNKSNCFISPFFSNGSLIHTKITSFFYLSDAYPFNKPIDIAYFVYIVRKEKFSQFVYFQSFELKFNSYFSFFETKKSNLEAKFSTFFIVCCPNSPLIYLKPLILYKYQRVAYSYDMRVFLLSSFISNLSSHDDLSIIN